MILQNSIPAEQLARTEAGLPGIAPVGDRSWITVDSAYAAQIAEKRRLLQERRPDVVAQTQDAPVSECLDVILAALDARDDFTLCGDTVICPDGRSVLIARNDPFGTIAQLIQEDICILEQRGDEHALTAALLCFPAGWVLAEKFDRPLMAIHEPVNEYDDAIGKRVQRLFHGIQVGRPLWRANILRYADADLYAPRKRFSPDDAAVDFMRSERQTLLRLPRSRAVVFAIHTTMVLRGQ